jgi:toxin ParE1/3/4
VKKNRLVLTDAAAADIVEQGDWYDTQSGKALAERWEEGVASAIRRVLNSPDTGTLCRFKEPQLSGVRRISIPRFPKHLLFYVSDGAEILVIRVVHGARDLESLF